jgi:hypothetical protein
VRTAAYRGLRRLAEHLRQGEYPAAGDRPVTETTPVTAPAKLTLKDVR